MERNQAGVIKYEKNYPNFLLNVGRFICRGSKEKKEFKVETFTWEKLDCQEQVKSAFGL